MEEMERLMAGLGSGMEIGTMGVGGGLGAVGEVVLEEGEEEENPDPDVDGNEGVDGVIEEGGDEGWSGADGLGDEVGMLDGVDTGREVNNEGEG